jgi:four helix bundle protein
MKGSFRDLKVYQKAFSFAMKIFDITTRFPSDENYELTHQIRRSSRAVCRAIGEGYRKRQYPRHFSAKMSDADMENSETQISLDFAVSCNYIQQEQYQELLLVSEEIGRMINHMVLYPEKYQPRMQP